MPGRVVLAFLAWAASLVAVGLWLRRTCGRAVVMEGDANIARPLEKVFDYCSDPIHEPEWNIRMKRIAKLSAGPQGVGSRYEMEFVPGRPMVVACMRFDRPTAWEMVGETLGMKVGLGGRVAATQDGAHLTIRMEMRPPGLLALASPLLRRRLQPELARDVTAIKTRLESPAQVKEATST